MFGATPMQLLFDKFGYNDTFNTLALTAFLLAGMMLLFGKMDTVRNTDGTLGVKMITLEFDIDRPGGDYRSLTTASVQQCRQVCTQEGSCRAFTYNRVSSLCWLKDNIPNTVSSTQGISGRK